MMKHLVDDYYFYRDPEEETGSIILNTAIGTTIIPGYDGRWTILEEAHSEDEAAEIAKIWVAQCPMPEEWR